MTSGVSPTDAYATQNVYVKQPKASDYWKMYETTNVVISANRAE